MHAACEYLSIMWYDVINAIILAKIFIFSFFIFQAFSSFQAFNFQLNIINRLTPKTFYIELSINIKSMQFCSQESCNNFQAGSSLRSKIKTKKLDETAIFGAGCRHEVPIKFFSLKRGEQ